LVGLRGRIESVLEPVGAWKLAVERIEAPILLIDDDNVTNPGEGLGFRWVFGFEWRGSGQEERGCGDGCNYMFDLHGFHSSYFGFHVFFGFTAAWISRRVVAFLFFRRLESLRKELRPS